MYRILEQIGENHNFLCVSVYISFFSMFSGIVLIKWLHKIYLEGKHAIEYSTAGYVCNVGFFAFCTSVDDQDRSKAYRRTGKKN